MMQLDIFIPSLTLAFEYQGEQHYVSSNYFGPAEIRFQRDTEKEGACANANITLIKIPYWWDRTKSYLISTISNARNDLMQEMST